MNRICQRQCGRQCLPAAPARSLDVRASLEISDDGHGPKLTSILDQARACATKIRVRRRGYHPASPRQRGAFCPRSHCARRSEPRASKLEPSPPRYSLRYTRGQEGKEGGFRASRATRLPGGVWRHVAGENSLATVRLRVADARSSLENDALRTPRVLATVLVMRSAQEGADFRCVVTPLLRRTRGLSIAMFSAVVVPPATEDDGRCER